jgi:hypothetical protein
VAPFYAADGEHAGNIQQPHHSPQPSPGSPRGALPWDGQ